MKNKAATLGSVYTVNDTWLCDCGQRHEFGLYAAAHWREDLIHHCDCGFIRTFNRGRVVQINESNVKKGTVH